LKVADDDDDALMSEVYHTPEIFKLNYAEMQRKFKVYIYPDGDPNTFYQTPRKLTGKYASEGYFFQNIRDSQFRTDDPDEAHMFFIPISCHKMRGKVYTAYLSVVLLDAHHFWLCFKLFNWILLLQCAKLLGYLVEE